MALPFTPIGGFTRRVPIAIVESKTGALSETSLAAAETNLSLHQQSVNNWSSDMLLVLLHVGVLDLPQLIEACAELKSGYQGLLTWANSIADAQRRQARAVGHYATTVHNEAVDTVASRARISQLAAQWVCTLREQSLGNLQHVQFLLQELVRISEQANQTLAF